VITIPFLLFWFFSVYSRLGFGCLSICGLNSGPAAGHRTLYLLAAMIEGTPFLGPFLCFFFFPWWSGRSYVDPLGLLVMVVELIVPTPLYRRDTLLLVFCGGVPSALTPSLTKAERQLLFHFLSALAFPPPSPSDVFLFPPHSP